MNTGSRTHKVLKLSAVASALLLGGCAYFRPLTAPSHAQNWPPKQPLRIVATGQGQEETKCVSVGCVEKAIQYGEEWQRHYYQYASDAVMLGRVVPAPIIPLSTIAAYRATGAKPNVELARGYATTAAALYIASGYLDTATAAKTYLAGAEGIACVLDKARPVAQLASDVEKLDSQHKKFLKALAKTQQKYTALRVDQRVRELTDHDKDRYKAVDAKIYDRVNRRLAYYERLASASGETLNELESLGDRVRGLVDEVVLQTAQELAANQPNLAKLKEALSELPALVTSLGSLPEEPQGLTDAPETSDDKKDAADPSDKEKPDAPPPVAAKNAPAASSSPVPSKEPAAKPSARRKDAAETKKKGTTQKDAQSAAERLLAILEANTGELQFSVDETGIVIQGKLTRPKSKDELDAEDARAKSKAAKAEQAAKDAKKALYDLLAAVRGTEAFKDLGTSIVDTAHKAHQVRLTMNAWKHPKTVTAGCADGDTPTSATGFAVTPKLAEKALVVNEPLVFVVRNARTIPTVRVAGENSAKVKTTVAVNGDAFDVTVTATDDIPATAPATLVLIGITGREVTTKLSATKKKSK
jgi:hypothetical protein